MSAPGIWTFAGMRLEYFWSMRANGTDPRLVWMVTVLAAAVFVVYVTHI